MKLLLVHTAESAMKHNSANIFVRDKHYFWSSITNTYLRKRETDFIMLGIRNAQNYQAEHMLIEHTLRSLSSQCESSPF
jgi:phosphopantetheine adenylyltransferase